MTRKQRLWLRLNEDRGSGGEYVRTASELTITLLYMIYHNELDLECFRNGIVVVEERGLVCDKLITDVSSSSM